MPFLDWINKNQAKQHSRDVPYHLLKHQLSYGDSNSARNNMLIQGDKLLALKALMPLYAGQVKCIFTHPYYTNTAIAEINGRQNLVSVKGGAFQAVLSKHGLNSQTKTDMRYVIDGRPRYSEKFVSWFVSNPSTQLARIC